MATLRKHPIESTPSAPVVMGGVASKKRAVPKLTEAQIDFYGGLGKTVAHGLTKA